MIVKGSTTMSINKIIARRVLQVASLITAATIPFALTGCNTMEGVGKDIGAAGHAIEDAASDADDADE